MSDAATRRRIGTQPNTSTEPSIRSCDRWNPARAGVGAMLTKSSLISPEIAAIFLRCTNLLHCNCPGKPSAFQGLQKQSARRSGAFLHFAAVELGPLEKN